MIKVLIVDDHDLVRMGISSLLDGADGIEVVGEADCGEGAIQKSRELRPHVVLMDANMPGIGGLEATRRLLRYDPDVKIIAVTVHGDEPYPTRFMQAGAAGYITKGVGIDDMIVAIKQVHHGKRYLAPDIAQAMALKAFNPDDSSPFDALSEREMQVMLMITKGQKVQEISDQLCLSPKTVNSYRYRLFEKLNVENDVELTHLALRHGVIDSVNI